MTHWTERSVDDYLYRIASDFVQQLENKIQSEPLSKAKLAEKLGVSKGRVSQILNNPGNLTLKMIIKCARALGLKVSIIAYEDNDGENKRGPINSEIFRICWENCGKPLDFWTTQKPRYTAVNSFVMIRNFNIMETQQAGFFMSPSDNYLNLQYTPKLSLMGAVGTSFKNALSIDIYKGECNVRGHTISV